MSTLFCSPCLFGSTSRLLAEDLENTEADFRQTNWLHIDTILYGILAHSGIQCLLGATRRTVIREELNIQGSIFKDWMTHIFLGPCAIAQESVEIRRHRSNTLSQASQIRYHEEQLALMNEMEEK